MTSPATTFYMTMTHLARAEMLTPDLPGHTANSWFWRPRPPKYSLSPYFLEIVHCSGGEVMT